MRRWLWDHRWLLLGLAGLALAAWALFAPRLGWRSARAQTAGDQSLLLQLAERLLTTYGSGSSVQIYPGALAPDFPTGVPLPSNSTLIGSDERPSQSIPPPLIYNGVPSPQATPSAPSGVHVDVVLDVPGSVDDLMSLYKQALTSAGWTPPTSANYGATGFIASNAVPQPTTYCRPNDHASLTITARTPSSGPLDVRLSYDTGFNPQCSPPGTPGLPGGQAVSISPAGSGLMPALQPPQGVRVVTQVNAPSPFHTTSEAVAVTDMSVDDLHSFYAGELSAAGWTQVSAGGGAALGNAPLAWSTWSIPGHSDLQGFLYVRDGPASGQRSLHLEIDSTDPNAALLPPFVGSAGSVTTFPLSGGTSVTPTATPAPTATP